MISAQLPSGRQPTKESPRIRRSECNADITLTTESANRKLRLESGGIIDTIEAHAAEVTTMKKPIAIWASVGFLAACCWVLYTFATPPEQLITSLREPIVEAIAFISLPIAFALRRFPLQFWWVPPINAATYAVIGLAVEMLRRKFHQTLAT